MVRRQWAARGSVRVRTTLGATVVVALALAIGGLGLVLSLRDALTDGVERTVQQQARSSAEVLEAGGTPSVLADDEDDTLAQVVDADSGRVLESSPSLAGGTDSDGDGDDGSGRGPITGDSLPPVAPDLQPGDQTTVTHVDDDGGDSEHYLAMAVEVGDEGQSGGEGGDRTLIVAGTLDDVDEAVEVVSRLLLLGLPALLLIAAMVTWRVVGRALAPVEAIRTSVDEVSAADLSQRVPEPASRDEVARLATTMNRMLGRLEESQARQRRFVADASHELRSPVTILRQHAEVARAHPARASLDDLSDTVLAEALRLQRLIDDLLVLARADEQRLTVRPRPLDLDDVVLEEVRRLRTTTSLDVDASAVSAGPVAGDADGMRRVVRNIVDNAARHAAGRVALSLSLSENGGTVVLLVDDDGPGVLPADRERVFQRFVRLDDARARDQGGSGLGLAIVAEIVIAHGGAVRLTEAPGLGGARVEITLPART
jgi:signal transduction histidine kinase